MGSVNDYFYWLQNVGLHETLDMLEGPGIHYHQLEIMYSNMVDIHYGEIHDRLGGYE